MRGDQLARQWRILRSFEASRSGLTVAEIAEQEDVSLRTAYRDIETLQLAGFPLYCEKYDKANRWFFVDSYKFKLPQPFSLTELMALYMSSDLMRVFKGTVFYDSLDSLFKKVRVTLPPATIDYLDRLQAAFRVGIKPYKDYARFRDILSQVNDAVIQRRRIEMVYRALRSTENTRRRVDPYRVWFFDGSLYLIGYCHLRKAVRTFVIDRIRMLEVTDEKFEVPEEFDVDDYLKHSFRVMQGELYAVRIRISPEWARYVGEKIWHESQRIEERPDGSIELSFRVAGLEEVRQWVMSLGPEAYVVEPDRLREMVEKGLRQTLDLYRTKEDAAASRSIPVPAEEPDTREAG